MPRKSRSHLPLAALTAIALLLPSTLLMGEGKGVIPGPGNKFPADPAKKGPSCGQCHGSFPNSRGVLSFQLSGPPSIQVGKKVRAGLTISSLVKGSNGGFNMQTDKGTWTPVGNTRANSAGNMLTHSNSQSRSWAFDFTSKVTGLVQWWIVGNTVDGNGRTGGDSWTWYAPNPALGLPGFPYRLFVNDSQVFPYGQACAGEKGILPLLGAAKNATVGKTFQLEAYNLPPSSVALFMIGLSDTKWGAIPLPFDLGLIGMKGCKLYASPDFFFAAATLGTGTANGSASLGLPLPNNPNFKGAKLYFQTLALDKKANAFGLSASGALKAVLQ